MVIRGIFTDSKLSPTEVSSMETVAYRTDGEYKGLKKGDLVRFDGYDKNFQVIWTFAQSAHQDDFEVISINTINNKPIKSMEIGKKNSMFSGILSRYTSQFMPEKEHNIRMSLGGTLCVCVDKNSDDWVAIDSNGELTSYPGSMTIDMPFIYSIAKPNNSINVGDIIKNGGSYAYVTEVSADGTLKIQSFSGYTHNKKAIKDAIMGQATTKVIINPFNFDEGCGFNPMMLALANGESFDVESLMALSMTPQGKNLFSNTGGGFNMAMLWMLNKKQGSGGGMLEMLIMSQMFGGPFANIFGAPKKESTEKLNDKIDKLTELVVSASRIASED